mmetsp:Transcript_65664/g.165449  ORF Transcript_65664/g.165449 Transcript_65664/m.165449 type:complete len:360 (+) Transcript_65664:2160-3239(+)
MDGEPRVHSLLRKHVELVAGGSLPLLAFFRSAASCFGSLRGRLLCSAISLEAALKVPRMAQRHAASLDQSADLLGCCLAQCRQTAVAELCEAFGVPVQPSVREPSVQPVVGGSRRGGGRHRAAGGGGQGRGRRRRGGARGGILALRILHDAAETKLALHSQLIEALLEAPDVVGGHPQQAAEVGDLLRHGSTEDEQIPVALRPEGLRVAREAAAREPCPEGILRKEVHDLAGVQASARRRGRGVGGVAFLRGGRFLAAATAASALALRIRERAELLVGVPDVLGVLARHLARLDEAGHLLRRRLGQQEQVLVARMHELLDIPLQLLFFKPQHQGFLRIPIQLIRWAEALRWPGVIERIV